MSYYLRQGVFVCFSGSYCTFLNLDSDRYFSIDRGCIEALAPWLSSCSNGNEYPTSGHEVPADAAVIGADLAALGLLTTHQLGGKPFQSVAETTSRSAPLQRQTLLQNALRFSAFYSACHAANQRLATARTRDTIEFVRRRKIRNSYRAPVRPAKLLSLISSFNALRPLYPRSYLCLFDSLALVEFLAKYGIFPTWVFGVRGEPFQAHCWVQHQDVLLNDSVDHVAAFTPIMTV